MTGHDAFDIDFGSWLRDEADAPIPAGARDHALAPIAGRRPRPARLASLGSHWSANSSSVTWPLVGRRIKLPAMGLSPAILLLLLLMALLGAAALVGGPLLERPRDAGRLAYALDGEVYLADADGRDPVRVSDGAGSSSLASGSIWAPDGRHFLYLGGAGPATAHIADPDGRAVASFGNLPAFNGYPSWSPDSTRLQAWTDFFTRITIYGIDGVVQAELALPEGHSRFRENPGVWAPDGRSVWVMLDRGEFYPCRSGSEGTSTGDPSLPGGELPPCVTREVWELPIDGSAPRRIVDGPDFMSLERSFTRDGTRMAFSGTLWPDLLLYVANADGTDVQPVVQVGGDPDHGQGMLPIWSPSGRQLAYFVGAPGDEGEVDLKVIDVATGTARTLVSGFQYAAWPPHSWSRDGNRILFSKQDEPGSGSLWTVSADGGDATVLVQGATDGEWQPEPTR